MKLIDVDDVIAVINNHHFDDDKNNFDLLIHNLCKEVKKIPTAYYVEDVKKQLMDNAYNETQDDMNPCPPCKVVALSKAIKIVCNARFAD